MAASRAAARAKGPAAAPLQAYVLHRYDWSETSLIVELFTREQGRVAVAAKGAKRPHSALRAVLMPFQPLQVLLGRAPADEQAELLNLRGADWQGGQPLLGGAALLPAFYMNELLLKLLARQDPHPALFDAYADALASLAGRRDGRGEGTVLRAFELSLLQAMGLLPALSQDTLSAQPLAAMGLYTLDPEAGLHPARSGAAGVSGAAWTAIAAALLHGAPVALRAACAPVAAGLRAPLQALLQYHLAGVPLRTRAVRKGLQRLAEASALADTSPPLNPNSGVHEPC
jgi:DNA repair protein RecO (recombination protein O)